MQSIDVVEHQAPPSIDEEVIVVAPSLQGNEVESFDSKRCLLGDSRDGESKNDDKGIIQGLVMLVAPLLYLPAMDSSSNAPTTS